MHPYIHSQLAQARTDDLIRQADRRRRRDNVPRRMPRSNTSHPPAAPFIDRPFRKAPVMTTIRPEGGCDTHDMVVVHRVFRREFTLIPQMARATPAGDTAQAAAVAAHIREMVHMLHQHHRGEDELLWPLLRERAAVDVEVIRQMETQHTAIAAILAPIEDALQTWVETADSGSRADLVALLVPLPTVLSEHLDAEELRVLPIVERSVTAAEWARLAERGTEAMPRPRMLVFLGGILEEADDTERREFLRHIPAPARVAYRLLGRRRFLRETHRQRRDLDTVQIALAAQAIRTRAAR